MTKRSAYKSVDHRSTVGAATSDAYAELQSLRDEMREWADDLEAGNLSHTQKCEEVNAAADALDRVADDEPEVPEWFADEIVKAPQQVSSRKGRSPGHSVRCGNAAALLSAAAGVAEGKKIDLEAQQADDDESDLQERIDALGELVDHLQGAADEVESVEFSGDVRMMKLFQETWARRPFWMLVGCVLVNRATWAKAEPVHRELVKRYGGPTRLSEAPIRDLVALLRPLGFQTLRARRVKALAAAWLGLPVRMRRSECVADLPGCGTYAADSWALFVERTWNQSERGPYPKDEKLKRYYAEHLC